MHRKFRISVDGRAFDVVVEELAGETSTVPPTGFHPVAAAAAVAAPAPVAAPAAAKPAAGAGAEVAPLAGVVDSIDVTVGQAITVGTKIAVVEAMKMKTEVFAKGAGTVASIAVRPGDPVDSGGVILTLA
jgi:biotin carboxyl carrier protein